MCIISILSHKNTTRGCAVNLNKKSCLSSEALVNNLVINQIYNNNGNYRRYCRVLSRSAILNVFDTAVKFYVMTDELEVPDDGILEGDYFYQ